MKKPRTFLYFCFAEIEAERIESLCTNLKPSSGYNTTLAIKELKF
jgi:hypothetical protein